MAVQRGQLGSAYRNIDFDKKVDSHVGELAKNYVDRQNKSYEEYKKGYTSLGELVTDVDARDADEALKRVVTSRDELAEIHKRYGANSQQYLRKVNELEGLHKAMAQRSALQSRGFLEAGAFLKTDKHVKESEARKFLDEQRKKGLMDRSSDLVADIRNNPALYNVDSWTAEQLNKMSPVEQVKWLETNEDALLTMGRNYRKKFATPDEKDPRKFAFNISDESVDELYNAAPEMWDTYLDMASKSQTRKVDEYNKEVGDVLQRLKDQGAGPEVIQNTKRAFMKSYLASVHKDTIMPSVPETLKVDEKYKGSIYDNTGAGRTEANKKLWISNLAKYIVDKDENALQSVFAGVSDKGGAKVKFMPNGDLIYFKKMAGRKYEKGDKPRMMQAFGINTADEWEAFLKENPEWEGIVVGEQFPVGQLGTTEGLNTAAATIHKLIGGTAVEYGGSGVAPNGKKKIEGLNVKN